MTEPRGEDLALVARIKRGDRVALEILYRRHAVWLTGRLQSRCSDPDLVDMAVQDTFVSVWKSAKQFRGDGAVGAWIWGIAIRRLIDQTRKRRPTPIDPSTIVAQSISFEEDLLNSGAYGNIGPALKQLEPDLAAVVVATTIDNLTTTEASRLLGIPKGTVKTRMMRARKQLSESLS